MTQNFQKKKVRFQGDTHWCLILKPIGWIEAAREFIEQMNEHRPVEVSEVGSKKAYVFSFKKVTSYSCLNPRNPKVVEINDEV